MMASVIRLWLFPFGTLVLLPALIWWRARRRR
jgi:cytochrome c-type biogenesis protein CcmH/NrfF